MNEGIIPKRLFLDQEFYLNLFIWHLYSSREDSFVHKVDRGLSVSNSVARTVSPGPHQLLLRDTARDELVDRL